MAKTCCGYGVNDITKNTRIALSGFLVLLTSSRENNWLCITYNKFGDSLPACSHHALAAVAGEHLFCQLDQGLLQGNWIDEPG